MCNELQSNELLLSEPFSTDPANHCAPLLDHFTEQDATGTRFLGDVVFLVFPLALKARVLPCRVALHALDAVHQTLEGLVFLHNHNIAHRNIHGGNLVVDVAELWPEGIDHVRNLSLERPGVSFPRPVHVRIRTPARYLYIDLGLSTRFEDGRRPVTWRAGLHDLPEVHGVAHASGNDDLESIPYDAFKADVYMLGRTLTLMFAHTVPGTTQLLSAMTATDPEQRPTARECLAAFRREAGRLSRLQMLLPVHDSSLWKLFVPDWRAYKFAAVHHLDWARIALKGLFTRLPDPRTRFS